MNGNLIIDFAKVDEVITGLKNAKSKLDNELDVFKTNYEVLNKNDVWYGKAQMSCYNKCNEMSKQFDDIKSSISAYITVLEKAKEVIKEFDEKVDKAVDESFG